MPSIRFLAEGEGTQVTSAPVRLCCGHRHYGAQCPDGLVMCILCFERVPVSELHVTEDGRPEDVCKACNVLEEGRCSTMGMTHE